MYFSHNPNNHIALKQWWFKCHLVRLNSVSIVCVQIISDEFRCSKIVLKSYKMNQTTIFSKSYYLISNVNNPFTVHSCRVMSHERHGITVDTKVVKKRVHANNENIERPSSWSFILMSEGWILLIKGHLSKSVSLSQQAWEVRSRLNIYDLTG